MPKNVFLSLIFLIGLGGCAVNKVNLEQVPFETMPAASNFSNAKLAWQRNCAQMPINNSAPDVLSEAHIKQYQKICDHYQNLSASCHDLTDQQFYDFLQKNFDLYQLTTDDNQTGLLTGYFQPDLQVSTHQTSKYKYPIYAKPRDLIVVENAGILNPNAKGIRIAGRLLGGTLVPYATYGEIIDQGLFHVADVIAWCDNDVDLFFAHIQGSARLVFEDGRLQHIYYDGTNGHRYTTIGRYMVDQGWLDLKTVSMQTIKQWLKDHPDAKQDVLAQNKSYIFFKPADATEGPLGAFKTVLTPQAAIAVDPLFIPLGSLVWLDADHPTQEKERLQQLVCAHDVGGVIKGPLRADFYWGSGDRAGDYAGVMKSQAKFYILLPKEME